MTAAERDRRTRVYEEALASIRLEGFELDEQIRMAGTTGFEPATSDVTGRRSNQLNYVPEGVETRR
jgi:hypothetical protein